MATIKQCVFCKLLTKSLSKRFNVSGNLRSLSTSQCQYKIVTDYKAKPIPAGVIDEEFEVLVIPGHSDVPEQKKKERFVRLPPAPPRQLQMKTDQDWTHVWPAAASFKWSAVPLPVRMGVTQGLHENKGVPKGAYANPELMKIPNFLHLTPAHIKKHCQAIRKFCTPWPEGLETDEKCNEHFPITIITRDYVRDIMSVRDKRARLITLEIKLGALPLDYHANDKMLRLVENRYNPKTGMLTLIVDRCPLKKQNIDYAEYLLTALFFESWKVEPWEADKEISDMEKYFWDIMPSKKTIVETIKMQKTCAKEKGGKEPSHLSNIPDDEVSEENVANLELVKKYKDAVSKLFNEGEDIKSIEQYKNATVQLLLGVKPEEVTH